MKISAVDIRPGMVLDHEGRLWRITKIMHTQPGKGGAYMQTEMKDIMSGTKTNVRFRSSEAVERAELEQREMQYLYANGDMMTLMDNTSYEQLELPIDTAGDQAPWLAENMTVDVEMHDGKVISVSLPDSVEVEVVQADAAMKGQTASSSFKNAVAANGVNILVPTFIQAGDRVVVSTLDGTYVERAK